MLVTTDALGTPAAEAWGRLEYGAVRPFSYIANLEGCSVETAKTLCSIDKEMSYEETTPHSIQNWQDLYALAGWPLP